MIGNYDYLNIIMYFNNNLTASYYLFGLLFETDMSNFDFNTQKWPKNTQK